MQVMDYSAEELEKADKQISVMMSERFSEMIPPEEEWIQVLRAIANELRMALTRTEGQRDALREALAELAEYATADIGLLPEEIIAGPIAKARAALSQAGEAANSPLPSPPKGATK